MKQILECVSPPPSLQFSQNVDGGWYAGKRKMGGGTSKCVCFFSTAGFIFIVLSLKILRCLGCFHCDDEV